MNLKSIPTNTINSVDYFKAYLTSGGFKNYERSMFENAGHLAPSVRLNVSVPTECPCCGKVLSDRLFPIFSVNNLDIEDKECEEGFSCDTVAVYKCSSCGKLFVIGDSHKINYVGNSIEEESFDFEYLYPYSNKVTVFSDNIIALSPEFVKIYNQSELAENQGLDEICGMGYRRSLEFLVDAYIRKENPNIVISPDMKLGKKIDNYIQNSDIQELAKKSTWLGNDATHIVKKHPNRNITDMKKFIRTMVSLIDFKFTLEDANTI